MSKKDANQDKLDMENPDLPVNGGDEPTKEPSAPHESVPAIQSKLEPKEYKKARLRKKAVVVELVRINISKELSDLICENKAKADRILRRPNDKWYILELMVDPAKFENWIEEQRKSKANLPAWKR